MTDKLKVNTLTSYSNKVQCPWCDHEAKINSLLEQVRLDAVRCKKCKKPFEIFVGVEVVTNTIKLEEEDLEW